MERDYGQMVRQGDVLLIPVMLQGEEAAAATPLTATDGRPLRGFRHRGEGGAHEHVIEDAVAVRLHGTDLIRLDAGAVLEHRQLTRRADAPHAAIPLPAGYYEPRVQRVWSPGRRFRFAD